MAKTGYVWDGTQFVSISSPIAAVPNAIGAYSSITPTSPIIGQIWYDTSTNALRVWSGSVWIDITSEIKAQLNAKAPLASPNFTGTLTAENSAVNGLLTVSETTEILNSGTISANVFTADFATGGVFSITSAPTANFTINVINLPTTDNRITVISFFVIQGATGYIPNAIQIGGAAQTIKWSGGITPTATSVAGKLDNFTFTFIRQSATWAVLGTYNRNF